MIQKISEFPNFVLVCYYMVILIVVVDEGICLLKVSAFIDKHLAYHYLNNTDFLTEWLLR